MENLANKKDIFLWEHERPFNAYSNYFKRTFGVRVQKLSINAGFTCPNRDGTLGFGGCAYCNNDAFNPSYCQSRKSITQQIDEGIAFHQWRYRRAQNYLAYFQPYSNTYGPLQKLKTLYEETLSHPQVMGLVIGTRPDCIDEEKLAYLRELSQRFYIIVEYGIESCYNKTLDRINRCHTFEQTEKAVRRTAEMGIKTGGHVIFGLPGESISDMQEEAHILSRLPLTTIKFHQLQIFKNTAIEQDYQQNPGDYTFFKLPEYVDFIIDFIERLNPSFVIERFAGEAPPRFLSGPNWGIVRYDQVLALIERRLGERNTWQGRLYNLECSNN